MKKKRKPYVQKGKLDGYVLRNLKNDLLSFEDIVKEAEFHKNHIDRIVKKVSRSRAISEIDLGYLCRSFLWLIPQVNRATKNSLEYTMSLVKKARGES